MALRIDVFECCVSEAARRVGWLKRLFYFLACGDAAVCLTEVRGVSFQCGERGEWCEGSEETKEYFCKLDENE